MNEAKQYESLEAYHLRDDKAYKQRIEETLKQVNVAEMIGRLKSKKSRSKGRERMSDESIPKSARDKGPRSAL